MSLSLDSKDVKVIARIALLIGGLIVVIAGVWTRDVAFITLGAGLMGAPGVANAAGNSIHPQEDEGEADE